jgi:hypothetical protein
MTAPVAPSSLRSLLIGWIAVGGICLAIALGPALLLRDGGTGSDAVGGVLPSSVVADSVGVGGHLLTPAGP